MAARLHAWVSGSVQGVCFRDFVLRRAGALALTGWVRNLGDGRVEVVAEGERAALDGLLDRLRAGPPAARVDAVEARWEDPAGDCVGFRIAPTDY